MKKIHIITVVISIVVILIISATFFIFYDKDQEISAIEGKILADEIAQDWNSSVGLVRVNLMTSIGGTDNGLAQAWGFSYNCNASSIGFAVTIFSNGSYVCSEVEPPTPYRINNWTIDSDEAFEIAKSNPEIKGWLDDHRNAVVQSMTLTAGPTSTSWGIAWFDSGFIDDPHTAVIGLNATTGEITNVYIQN